MRPKSLQLLVLGQGPTATGLTAALAALPGVISVRQQGTYQPGMALPKADLCFEMLGGISLALEACTQALAQGMGLVLGSPALAATHGAMLHAAARGQGAFFANAAHGCGILPAQLAASGAAYALLLPDSTPQTLLRRMAERAEPQATALAELQRRAATTHAPVFDTEGKETHARAHALLGAWHGQWLHTSQQPRSGLGQLEPAHLRLANALGMMILYGARIAPTGIATGPMALPAHTPAPTRGTEALLAPTPFGLQSFTFPTLAGPSTALLAAAHRALQGPMRLAEPLTRPAPAPVQAPSPQLVMGPLSLRRTVQEQTKVLEETTAGALWSGLVAPQTPAMALPPEALVLPVPYAPATAHATPYLRLVG